jgi:F-type H+-transporting ATPase subunit epsilon
VKLKVLMPAAVLLEEDVSGVTAEAENGFFTLLPRHVDFVAALVPGIFSYVTAAGEERFLALDSGVLVKQGDTVFVSVTGAMPGASLAELKEVVEIHLAKLGENEKKARAVLSRLEVDTLRRFAELGGNR